MWALVRHENILVSASQDRTVSVKQRERETETDRQRERERKKPDRNVGKNDKERAN